MCHDSSLCRPAFAPCRWRGIQRYEGPNSMRKSMRSSIVVAAVVAAFAASTAFAETIEVHGSTTVSNNLLLPKKADFEKATGFELQIVGNGSGRGLTDLIEGKVKLAMISAPLADEVKSLKAKGAAV